MSEALDLNETALSDPWSVPLEDLDPSQPIVFQTNAQFPIFERLRSEAPFTFMKAVSLAHIGPSLNSTTSWRSTKIMRVSPQSRHYLTERQSDFTTPNFISMDPCKTRSKESRHWRRRANEPCKDGTAN